MARVSRYIVLVKTTDEQKVRSFAQSPPAFKSVVASVGDIETALKKVEETEADLVAVPEDFAGGAAELCAAIRLKYPSVSTALMREDPELIPPYIEFADEYLPPWDIRDTTTRITTALAVKSYNDAALASGLRIEQALATLGLGGERAGAQSPWAAGLENGRLLCPARFAPGMVGELQHFKDVLAKLPGVVDASLVPRTETENKLVTEALMLRVPTKRTDEQGRQVCAVPLGMRFRSWYEAGAIVAVVAGTRDGAAESNEIVELLQSFAELVSKELSSLYALNFAVVQREVESREKERAFAQKNAQLNRLNQRLKELIQLRTDFVANVSHEMRTPLTRIVGYTDMVLKGQAGAVSEEARSQIAEAAQAARQLEEFIDQLLDFPTAEMANQELAIREFELEPLLGHLKEVVSPSALQKGLDLQIARGGCLDGSRPGVKLRTDRSRLEKVLWHLLRNAVKFTSQGSVWLAAESGRCPEALGKIAGELMLAPPESLRSYGGEVVVFEVGDTGIGIRPADMRRIFEGFRQIDPSPTRSFGGIGIGLAVVKRLVPMLRGAVWAESALGKGAVFRVLIPADLEAFQAYRAQLWEEVQAAEPPLGPDMSKLILGVSSDPGMILRLRRVLGAAGFRVASAPSFAEAIQKIRGLTPAAVILDENYDNELWDASTSVGGDLLFSGPPVIVLSPFKDSEIQSYNLGAHHFVLKPCEDSAIREYLQKTMATERRILLVSQQQIPTPALTDVLRGAGYELSVVRSSQAAIVRARSAPIEAIIFEPFPEPDGAVQTARTFHPLARQLNLKLIFLRGENYTEYDTAQIAAYGAQVAPLNEKELEESLVNLLSLLKPSP